MDALKSSSPLGGFDALPKGIKKHGNKYQATISINKKPVYKLFATPEEAVEWVKKTRAENKMNGTRAENKYGRHIMFREDQSRFVVQIHYNGKLRSIGNFKTHAEAITARDEALKIMGIES
ncbi:MAG: hypothetical protein WC449_05795 [Candidatus Paceibacterota bacterium]